MEPAFNPTRFVAKGNQDVLPASQYLQERLQDRRARNTRPRRSRQSDFGPRRARDDAIFLDDTEESRSGPRTHDSSPLPHGSRNGSEADSSAHRRRTLGVKDMDDQMDRLSKQNFDLKLELDYRREETLKLQKQLKSTREQVEWAQRLEEEHAQLLEINSQLVDELEKRDKAVEEAMDIICDLEDKVADMEERSSTTRPSTSGNADSGYAGTETHEQAVPSSPLELHKVSRVTRNSARHPPGAASAASNKLFNVVNGETPLKMRREPSILSQKKPSTHALRSVYLETTQNLHPVKSFNSFLTKRDAGDDEASPDQILNSPRLSVLSESSFPSLYSPKKQVSPERYSWEAVNDDDEPSSIRSHFRQDSIKRVSQWMSDGGDVEDTPSKSTTISPPLFQRLEEAASVFPRVTHADSTHVQSLNDALSMASTTTPQQSYELLQPASLLKTYLTEAEKRQSNQPAPSSIAGPIFGEPLLPPTPESASTHMLRASRSSIADDRSLLDITPAAVKGYDALEPSVRTAPKQMRSSIELNSAYFSNLQYRKSGLRHEQDYDELSSDDEDVHVDARSETVRDLGLDYDGFPDGNSIIMGTPSRFLRHTKPPVIDMLLGDSDASQPDSVRTPLRRRQSSSEATVSPRKPSITRAETSPKIVSNLHKFVGNGSRSTVETMTVTSPTRSTNSGSSGNRTIIQHDDRHGSLSSELVRTQSRVSESPARTLSQKTQKLFRRLSNSHSDPREKHPMPTMTSTSSSAYVNAEPKQGRRPSTGDVGRQTPTLYIAQPPPSSREVSRPSLQGRKSEPAAAMDVTSTERRNPFKCSNSVKKATEISLPADLTIGSEENVAARGGITMRRGSIREAVGNARRPWR